MELYTKDEVKYYMQEAYDMGQQDVLQESLLDKLKEKVLGKDYIEHMRQVKDNKNPKNIEKPIKQDLFLRMVNKSKFTPNLFTYRDKIDKANFNRWTNDYFDRLLKLRRIEKDNENKKIKL